MVASRIKVLNLYAGIGGNRALWTNVDVVAVEIDDRIASIYKSKFPNDLVIVGDAHEFLLEHYKEFDFIWASPPCPSHSRIRYLGTHKPSKDKEAQNKPIYPDMRLYQEILFLKGYFKGLWCVENVIPWYEPMLNPQVLGRHCFWANFKIPFAKFKSDVVINDIHDTMVRNMVDSKLALHVFKSAFKDVQVKLSDLVGTG